MHNKNVKTAWQLRKRET